MLLAIFLVSLLHLFPAASLTFAQEIKTLNLVAKIGNGDFDKGLDHIVSHAKQGNGAATFVYANLFLDTGDTKNYHRYLTLSAKQDNPVEMKFLATSFFKGVLVKQDFDQAKFWFGKSAKYRNINSMVYLGMMHRDGLGTKTDLKKSYFWFTLAGKLKPKVKGEKDPMEFAQQLQASLSTDEAQKITNEVSAWLLENPEIKLKGIPPL